MKSILEVVTAATSRDLTSVATVKEELGLTGAADQAVLQRYIQAASSQIVGWCKREFAAEPVTETWRLTDRDRRVLWGAAEVLPLCLQRFPVSAVSSVTIDAVALVEDTDFEVDAEAGLLWRLDGTSTPSRRRWSSVTIVVTYTGGYALLDDLPPAVQDACIGLVKQRWFARKRDPSVRSEDVPGVRRVDYWVGSIPGADDMPTEIAGLLEPYRVIAV